MLNLQSIRLIYSPTGYEPVKSKENKKIPPSAAKKKSVDMYIKTLKKHGNIQRINLIKHSGLCRATIDKITKILISKNIINIEKKRNGKQVECFISLK